ncbi:hypothetical protein BDN70DRAFT_927193 [Pholiota conissans]|uniref:Uncharacterized protein n=1 Tax=Pholiota conissans TaxID=109636 RepID=A0A9P6D6R0_9AGAR|nr:hypothetical protein BDN70DRAFT_927193 [Pholiota conissans]
MLGFRTARILLSRRALSRRHLSTEAPPAPRPMPKDETGDDFRPSWVYLGSRLVSWVVIPGTGLYSIFFYDFGDHEHVFQPVRRWGADTVNGFFSLSSSEKRLQLEDASTPQFSDSETTA